MRTIVPLSKLKYTVFIHLIMAVCFSCAKSVKEKPVEKESDSYGWIDDHTFQLRTNGTPPEKTMDLATAKLLACENARNFGIKLFNFRFLKNSNTSYENPLYPDQKFTKQFHDYKIEIRTVQKENDPGGNCYLQLQFSGKDLKKRLVPFEDKSVAPTTRGWD